MGKGKASTPAAPSAPTSGATPAAAMEIVPASRDPTGAAPMTPAASGSAGAVSAAAREANLTIKLGSWKYTRALAGVVWEVLTQRRATQKLGPASWACHESIRGKTVIVTGSTSGIGLETAREMAVAGAHVVLACRRTKMGQHILDNWRQDHPDKRINGEVQELDLCSLESVRAFAEQWELSGAPVHVLVNNAGVFCMGGKQKMTVDGVEEHLQVNFISPLLLTLLMLPALVRSRNGRVVHVSSVMHELGSLDVRDLSFTSPQRRYSATAAYCQSKLAQLLLTNFLHRKLPQDANVDIVAVHPGEVLTNVARTLPFWLRILQRLLMRDILLTPSYGARGPLFCATHPSVHDYADTVRRLQQKGGPYYSFALCPVSVADTAKKEAVGRELWKATLELLQLPSEIVEEKLREGRMAVNGGGTRRQGSTRRRH